MKILKLLLLFIVVYTLNSCEKSVREIEFEPNTYNVPAFGGEVITSVASSHFKIYGSAELRYAKDYDFPFYHANEEGTFLEADFFTAERTNDYRIKFNVQPNTTHKKREWYIQVTTGNDNGIIYLNQNAN